MKTVLFQGASITDERRDREDDNFKGSGYATPVSARLGYERPDEFRFLNRSLVGFKMIFDI